MKKFIAALEWVPAPLTQCAALAIELDGKAAPTRIRVIPDGDFDAVDGRPGNIKGVKAKKWHMDAAIAEKVIAQFTQRGIDLPVDYEHQTIKAADNGRPAPAAGWITGLEYQSGVGLVALVRDIEGGRGIPILFKHYLKLGGKIGAFHLDTTFNTLDAFLLMDIVDSPRSMLERYMSPEGAGELLSRWKKVDGRTVRRGPGE